MLKQKTLTFYRMEVNLFKGHFSLILCISILAIVAAMTFVLQSRVVGFEPGYDAYASKHHGSVSSKTLAIITQANMENGFVGFAFRTKDALNNIHYDYFDRYPVFFSALFHRLLALRPKLSSQIYLARQAMNFIFLATLLVAFLLCDKLIKNKPLALTATLIAFANPFLLFYKDMVHFDQPALFGFLLLTYAIALYKIDGLRWPLFVATIVAVAMGRGYASLAILGFWLVIEAFLILRAREQNLGQKIRSVVKHPAFILLIIGTVWAGGLLSYNIIVEAQKRNIPILETSIIDSAGRRLSLNAEFNQENDAIINWPEYIRTEVNRIIKWTFPVKWANLEFYGNSILLVIMLVIIGAAIRRQPPEKRLLFILLAFSGFAWMIPMRNMAAFHDYTTMYFIGVPLAFFLSLLILLKPSKDATYYLALMAMVVYLSGITQVRDLHDSIAGNANDYTYDFMRIEESIGSRGNDVFVDGKVPYGTNAIEYYLSDQYLAPLSIAEYVVTTDKNYAPHTLTPDNSVMFLFKKEN